MAWMGVYVLTFNCARNPIDTGLVSRHLFDVIPSTSDRRPEVLVLSLQEVAPLSYAFLGGSLIEPYLEAFRRAVEQAGGNTRYQNVVTRNVGMTVLMVFVREDVADRISWIETAEVGLGVQEAGNKGAVGARLGFLVDPAARDTVNLTFVAAHLAPAEHSVERRNEDWANVKRRLVFTRSKGRDERPEQQSPHDEEADEEGVPLLRTQSTFGEEPSALYVANSHLFVAGDLNYRTASDRPGPDDSLTFPQDTEDMNNPRHWRHFLIRDQLTQELQAQRTLDGLSELPIKFPPTYKFPVGAPRYGNHGEINWVKTRWPSWTDRILYRDAASGGERIKAHNYDVLPVFPTSDHQPVALLVSVPLQPTDEIAEAILPAFEIDPSWKSRRAAARQKELLVGAAAYGLFTWQGNGLIVATCFLISAGYFALRAYFEG